jgi:hypothetical protein
VLIHYGGGAKEAEAVRPATVPMLSPLISLHWTVHTASQAGPCIVGAIVLRLRENSWTTAGIG